MNTEEGPAWPKRLFILTYTEHLFALYKNKEYC